MAAQGSNDVTAAARTELQQATLNPEAREFLPWWRLGGSRKQLSADAPEFISTALGKAAAAAAARGVVIAPPPPPNNAGTGRAAEDSAHAPDSRRPAQSKVAHRLSPQTAP